MYSSLSYWLASRIITLPLDVLCAILFAIITYWMAGLRNESSSFLWWELFSQAQLTTL